MIRQFPLAAALVCLAAALAPATTFSHETTGDLVVRARQVCCVSCEEVEARRDPVSGLVFTHVRLRLLEDIKGRAAASSIRLRIVGGRAGGVETKTLGMPTFRPGEESILLLGPANSRGYPVLLQARRGVLSLKRDKRGGRYVVTRVSGIPELRGKRHVTLDAFRGAVKRLERKARPK